MSKINKGIFYGMKVEITTVFIALLIAFLFFYIIRNCKMNCFNPEKFGQDATTRTQVGWLAGPKGMYGYDPIDSFAKQIEEMREMENKKAGLYMMTNFPNLESSPTKDIGPWENYREGHPPYGRKCRISGDCWEGEGCYNGTCLPANVESFKPSQEGKTCKSCMATEDF